LSFLYVTTHNIIPEKREVEENEYLVERGISVVGTTDSYLSIFKQLVPGGLPVDLSAYNTLSFDVLSQGVYEVTLLTSGNTNPAENHSYTLDATNITEASIPFSHFTNASGTALDASDITTIYIAYQAAVNNKEEFALEIENVTFKNNQFSAVELSAGNLEMYPNPSAGQVQLSHVFSAQSDALITVYNANGAIVKQFSRTAYKGRQTFDFSFENNEQGIYLISLQTNEGVFSNTLLLMK